MFSLSKLRNTAFLFVFSALFFVSCKQTPANSVLSADDNGGYASDASRIELFNNDAISIVDVAGNFYNAVYIGSSIATVATDTFSSPHRLTIRFGDNTDYVCLDGRKRTGNISVSYNGNYLDTASLHTITFDNYFVDGYQLTGTIKLTRVDTTIVGDWYYKVSVDDSLTITPDQYVVWKGTLLRKWVGGYNTGTRNDDIFSISGNATLTRPNTHSFAFDIATPLQFAINWNYAESGVVNVSGAEGIRVLNYGYGVMDNKAQININTNAYPILLSY